MWKWVSVTDEIPPPFQRVLAFVPAHEGRDESYKCILYWAVQGPNDRPIDDRYPRWDDGSGDSYQDYNPSYWAELPDDPA